MKAFILISALALILSGCGDDGSPMAPAEEALPAKAKCADVPILGKELAQEFIKVKVLEDCSVLLPSCGAYGTYEASGEGSVGGIVFTLKSLPNAKKEASCPPDGQSSCLFQIIDDHYGFTSCSWLPEAP